MFVIWRLQKDNSYEMTALHRVSNNVLCQFKQFKSLIIIIVELKWNSKKTQINVFP